MKEPIIIVSALIEREGKVLVYNRPKYDCWTFPGGKVGPTESLEEALNREVKEEIGVDVLLGPKIGEYDFENKGKPHRRIVYGAEIREGEPEVIDIEAFHYRPIRGSQEIRVSHHVIMWVHQSIYPVVRLAPGVRAAIGDYFRIAMPPYFNESMPED